MKKIINRINEIEEEVIKKEKESSKNFLITEMKKIGIEKLPYSYNALRTFIDRETMDVHYNKHYKTYVEKLNLALDKEKYGDLDLEQIVKTISRFNKNVRNNAGGAYNHALFWKMLSPTKQNPKGMVLKRIEKDFGTLAKFKKEFEEVAKERFGSGWVWLVVTKNNTLKIMSTPNQDNPLMNDVKGGGYPILGLDLWEHAYYLKYKNEKNNYIKKFWDAVNWEFVEKLYKMKVETRIDEEIVLRQILSNDKDLLSEAVGVSESCSRNEELFFKNLLFPSSFDIKKSPKYKMFIKTYVEGWANFLRKKFPSNWREKDTLFIGHLPGLYDKENRRLLLNNITSSYSVFCVVHRDVNKYLAHNGQETIKYSNNPDENITQLNKFFSVLDGIGNRLFDSQKSSTYKRIEKILRKTDCIGKRNEDAAKKIIDENLGKDSCQIIAGGGLATDMMQGKDAIVKLNSKDNSGQIKPYKTESVLGDIITIGGSSGTKNYNSVDLMIFVNTSSKVVRIFKTKGITTKGSEYYIPVANDVLTIKGSSNIELLDCSEYL